jgi:C1A family cysteine protease
MIRLVSRFCWAFVIIIALACCGGGDNAGNTPEAFDLRNVAGSNFVTPVKTQTALLPDGEPDLGGSVGLCWAFASMASFESSLLFQGLASDPNSASVDLSEWHLGNWNGKNNPVYTFNYDFIPGTDPPATYGYTQDKPVLKGWGGDSRFAIDYFSSGKGPVLEKDAPYPIGMITLHETLSPPSRELPVAYRLKEALIFSRDDYSSDEAFRSVIKRALMTYGVLQSFVYFDAAGYPGQIGKSFFNKETSTYYCDDPDQVGNLNHGVAIAGWDDKKAVPGAPGSGAWLIKNSAGTKFGEGGYFWVSYYDVVFLKGDDFAVAFIAGSANGYGNPGNYQTHDGSLSQITFIEGTNAYDCLCDDFADIGDDSWGCARFTATNDNQLKAVGFVTCNRNEEITINVYENWDNGDNRPGNLIFSKTLKIAEAGYHTVDLGILIPVTEGQEFVIALSFAAHPYQKGDSLVYVIDQKTPPVAGKTYRNSYNALNGWGQWTDYATLYGGSVFYVQGIMEK